jgi:hypothetical protein
VVAATLAVAVTAGLAAVPNRIAPGQRVDVKVLLVSADGTEPGFGAWKAELTREGVPYDTFVAYQGATRTATLTDDKLADYAAGHAMYSAVILSTGDLGRAVANPDATTSYLSALTDGEWTALAKLERTFGIRQLSDYTAPTPGHGLTTVGGAAQDGITGTLTDAGRAAFPYLKGPVPIANDDATVAEAFGYQATPTNGQDWQSLVAGPNNTSYLGIYTHPDDGREEMVGTVAGNENQSHIQLLRHGMLNWVTRGVFLGFQRHYLEVQVDDLFLGDDAWDPTTHTTNYDPATASRMSAADLRQAVTWSKAHGIRLDFAFNGGGSALWLDQVNTDANPANDTTSDGLVTALQDPATRGAFGFINHTFDHPNIDCATAPFITKEITDNVTWGAQHALPLDAAEVITGEHSGLANSRPGNPGTIDPPSFDDVQPATVTGGAVPAGTYDYAITARSAAGETLASTVAGVAVALPSNAVTATFNAVCHAVRFTLYRAPAGTTSWSVVGTLDRAADAVSDNGTAPLTLSITDARATGTAGTPPTVNGAAIAPYGQNPNYLAGLTAAGIGFVATDASKAYPSVPSDLASPPYAAGATFRQGTPGAGFQAVPRYPSNVYYNVSRQGQQLDEYNWIYVAPANGGGCVPIAQVTTCRTATATWDQYVTSENTVMFRHLMGNDPRPHFVHQSNLADYNPALPETDPNQGGIVYSVFGALLQRYDTAIDRASTPLVQLSTAQIAQTLSQQDTWAANLASGKITAWLEDGRLHVKNAGAAAIDVPITGTTVGERYGNQRSGWTTIPAATERVLAPDEPTNTSAPDVSGTPRVGSTLKAEHGTWTGTAPIAFGHHWQRCNGEGAECRTIAGATGETYAVTTDDVGSRLRVVVGAGNWIAAVSQAISPMTGMVPRPPPPATSGQGSSGSGDRSGSQAGTGVRLKLTTVRMNPRRFRVASKRRRPGTRLDGSRITWRLNRTATVRLRVQRLAGTKHRRWVTVGTITRRGAKGTNVVRFTGRFGKRMLTPRAYRLRVTAAAGGWTAGPKHISFRVMGA